MINVGNRILQCEKITICPNGERWCRDVKITVYSMKVRSSCDYRSFFLSQVPENPLRLFLYDKSSGVTGPILPARGTAEHR
jgi:hypothetical protein